MQIDRFPIEGPLLLTPRLFADNRGYFLESWNQNGFAEALGVPVAQAPVFHQDNQSRSCRGVLRCLWVPVGFAHGILTLCDSAEVLYKASGFWSKTCEPRCTGLIPASPSPGPSPPEMCSHERDLVRVLLTGPHGQLGQALRAQVPAGIELIAYERVDLDFDLADGELSYTAVDRVESEPELAHAVNAAALAVRGGRLLQVSTDLVFNGNQSSPYRPEQPVDHGQVGCPTSTHALAAESHVDRSIDGPGTFLESYCVGGHGERRNREVVDTICRLLDELRPAAAADAQLIPRVSDRPGHDRRHAIDPARISTELGWQPRHSLEQGLAATVARCLDHLRAGYSGGRLGQLA